MANSNGWGDGAANNAIGWGKGANNAIGWGNSHSKSWTGATDIVGTSTPVVPTVSDANAQAFLNAAVITNTTQANAINNLVVGLKADGLWANMQALYPFVGGTASTHKWNLKDPRDLDAAYRLQFGGGWVHNTNGATGNGTNTFANTYLVGFNQGQIGAYGRDVGSYSKYVAFGGANILSLDPILETAQISPWIVSNASIGGITSWFSNSTNYENQLFAEFDPPYDSIGFISLSGGDGSVKNYRNGILINQLTPRVNPSPLLIPIYLGATNVNSPYTPNYCNAQLAFGFITTTVLNGTQNTNLYNRVQAFQTALSRNV
jgi:hypothetical protein